MIQLFLIAIKSKSPSTKKSTFTIILAFLI